MGKHQEQKQICILFSTVPAASQYKLLPPSLNVSISRVQNFAHNISIPMDKDKNKGVGGWMESWWIV
jgi:hypothetical protein